MTHYSFERPFRLKIVALLLNNAWCAKFGAALIEPEYFEQEDEEYIVKAILDYRKSYKHSPADPDDLITLMGKPEFTEIVRRVYDLHESGDMELASDLVVQFAKEQAVKLAILDSIDEVNAGDLEAPVARVKEALRVGDNLITPGIDPIRDVGRWLYEYWQDKVPTGIRHLDMVMEGGLGPGELGIWIGPPNRGKSMSLINVGYGAAAIGSGRNVIHFTHEMSVKQVAKRYAARMMFRFPDAEENLDVYADELMEVARRMMPGRIRIIGGRMTSEEIDSHICRLEAEGFKPGLIIDDYPDLIQASKRYTERRFELSGIYQDCRDIAVEHNLPFWGATQGTRGSLSKEIITMADVAEDIGKAAIADVMPALCQTYDEEQTERARIFMAKLRDSSKQGVSMIACKFYGRCQALISTEYVKPKEEQDA